MARSLHWVSSLKVDSELVLQVKFHLLNLEENLPLNNRLVQTTFNCPEFILRTLPRERTPHTRPAPFPEHLIDHGKKAHRSIGLGIVTSKVRMSKLAVERNRGRRRIVEALGYVVNRGVMCPPGVNGWDLVSEGVSPEPRSIIPGPVHRRIITWAISC